MSCASRASGRETYHEKNDGHEEAVPYESSVYHNVSASSESLLKFFDALAGLFQGPSFFCCLCSVRWCSS